MRTVSNRHFWAILITFIAIVILNYPQELLGWPRSLSSWLGLQNLRVEPVLFLIPVIYASIIFRVTGGTACLAAAFAAMLPIIIVEPYFIADLVLEIYAIIITGSLIICGEELHRRDTRYRNKAIHDLDRVINEKERLYQESELAMKRYRELFEKAYDAIWVQDLDGKILTANPSAAVLTGYSVSDLIGKDVITFLNPKGLDIAREVKQTLLAGKEVSQPYEQTAIRKDGTQATLMVTTSLLGEIDRPEGFQHVARDVTREKRLQDDLRRYINQVSQAHEEERNRIARELHDDTAQALVAVSHHLDRLMSRWQGIPPNILERIEAVRKELDDTQVRLRRLLQDLRPATLEYLGFLPALNEILRQTKQETSIETTLQIQGTAVDLGRRNELLAYRIVQEALSNIRKHSGASRATVKIDFIEGLTRVTVNDNGKGFTQNGDADFLGSGKLGLMGMIERANLLGGSLHINSQVGQGTNVTLDIPRPSSAGSGPTRPDAK